MHLILASVGRSKNTVEGDLAADYLVRAGKTGRSIGIKSVSSIEVDAVGGPPAEVAQLSTKLPSGALIVACDETGEDLTSRAFADLVGQWRDRAVPAVCVCIGGADGWTDGFRAEATKIIRFGRQTWPHKLARVMAAEQIYRATTILAGLPYHRD